MGYFSLLLAMATLATPVFAKAPAKPVAPKKEQIRSLLLQFAPEQSADDGKLKDALKKHGLTKTASYKDFKVSSYRFKNSVNTEEAKTICAELVASQLVKLCEPNIRLKTENDCFTTENPNQEVVSMLKVGDQVSKTVGCELYTGENSAPGTYPDLGDFKGKITPYWAQEYVGADLARKDFPELARPHDTAAHVVVLDSPDGDHNQYVRNIISGSGPESIVGPLAADKAQQMYGQYAEHYLQVYEKMEKSDRFPSLLNNSMTWDIKLIPQVFRKFADRGVVAVVSAGNSANIMEADKRVAPIVSVASLDPDGKPSDFTSFATEVTIAAPSNSEILASKYGKKQLFGGTSGAAPVVTGALLAFEVISGARLTLEQAKTLLTKTAIPLPISKRTLQAYGAGMVNSYLISAVAKRVQSQCGGRNPAEACVSKVLNEQATYNFPKSSYEEKFAQGFPECVGGSKSAASTCDKREALEAVRREALLHPQDPTVWKLAACAYEQEGLSSMVALHNRVVKAAGSPMDDDAVEIVIGRKKEQREDFIRLYAEKDIDNLRLFLEHPDEEIRRTGIYAATKIGKPALKYLKQAVKSEDTVLRWSALEELMIIGGKDAEPYLAESLKETFFSPVPIAAFAYAVNEKKIKPKMVEDALSLPWKEGEYSDILKIKKAALSAISALPSDRERLLFQAIRDEKREMRSLVIDAAGKLRPEGDAVLRLALKDEDECVRVKAAGYLRQVDAVMASYEREPNSCALDAAWALGEQGVEILKKAMSHESENIREKAFELGSGLEKHAMEFAKMGIKERNMDIKKKAFRVAYKFAEDPEPFVKEAMQEEVVVGIVIDAIGKASDMGDKGLPYIIQGMNDDSDLSLIRDTADGAAVDDEALGMNAVSALMQSKSPKARSRAVYFSLHFEEKALSLQEKALKDDDQNVRLAAFQVLLDNPATKGKMDSFQPKAEDLPGVLAIYGERGLVEQILPYTRSADPKVKALANSLIQQIERK